MMIYVNKIDLSTSLIENLDEFIDILISKKIKHLKNKTKRSIDEILKGIRTNNESIVVIGGNIDNTIRSDNLIEALKNISDNTIILCQEIGSNGLENIAAINVSLEESEDTFAIIKDIEEFSYVKKKHNCEKYHCKGPVLDLMLLIKSCIELKYGFDFSRDLSENCLYISRDNNLREEKCDISCGSIYLKEAAIHDKKILKTNKYIIPVPFNNKKELIKKLDSLLKETNVDSIEKISYEHLKLIANDTGYMKIVVFCADTKKNLKNEINLFIVVKESWFEPDFKWTTSMGSCYVSEPIGGEGKVCYISPPGGMFSKEAFYRLYRRIDGLKKYIDYEKFIKNISDDLIKKYYFQINMIMLGVKALECMGIKQDAVIGGSLGELSIPIIFEATTADIKCLKTEDFIQNVISILEKVISSQSELSRKYFNKEIGKIEKWYLVCNYEDVKRKIESFPSKSPIFITIIGSQKDVIISGTHDLCEEVIKSLKCYALEFEDPIYAHTPVLEPAAAIIKKEISKTKLHYKKDLDFDIYSTSKLKIMDDSIEEFCENCSDCLINQVDMPEILRKTYEDGCRVYVDLGSSMFCSRWARETFNDYKDVLIFSPFQEKADEKSILSIISNCITNKINLDFSRIFDLFFKKKNRKIVKAGVKNLKEDNEFLSKLALRQVEINKDIFYRYILAEERITDIIASNKTTTYKRNNKALKRECLYDYDEILEMTNGSMSKILGNLYKGEDKYKVRARMPLPPYLFVSRILNINAKYGEFIPGSSIEAEYDIDENCILKVSPKTVSSVVFSEAAHIGIFLAGYMGIDVYSSGKSKFRITDVSTKYVSETWPQIGDTIRLKFTIDKFIKSGNITLLLCDFKVYLRDKLIVDAKETGGFFTQEALNSGAGITNIKMKSLSNNLKSKKSYEYKPVSNKKSFNKKDLHDFLCGNYKECFGVKAANTNTPYKVCKDSMFIDEIKEISKDGGKYNLGYIVAKRDIDDDFWPFKCHFKNDPVLPGTIMLEGLNQAVTFFQTFMGLYLTEKPFIIQMKTGYEVKTKFRGEVKKGKHTIIYRIDTKKVQKLDDGILFVADGEVYCDNLQVIEQKDLAMIIKS